MENYEIKKYLDNTIDFLARIKGLPTVEDELLTEHLINGTYKHFFEEYMSKIEGSPCCCDKAGFITEKTEESLKLGTSLDLYTEYKQTDFPEKPESYWKGKQAYWSPVTIKTTGEAIEIFYNWFYNPLFMERSTEYKDSKGKLIFKDDIVKDKN